MFEDTRERHAETEWFRLSSRYYSPELCRFISLDDIDYLDPELVNGLNLYCYCMNDPINFCDPSGHSPEWWQWALNGLTLAAGIVAGIAVFGALNNLTNTIYYNFISDGESDLTSSSYRNGCINRWDRLDYVKQQTGQDVFNTTAWMYFSEYNLHMYGWYLTGWAHEKNVPLISDFAKSTYDAYITVGKWDSRWYVNIGIVILRLLGLYCLGGIIINEKINEHSFDYNV